MVDLLNDLESLMQGVRDVEDRTFPALLMSRAARIAGEILAENPGFRYTWEDIRRDFQPRNADPFDRRNLGPAREVALSNVDHWTCYEGDEVRNIELASSLSSLRYLHRVNPGHDANGTRLLMRDIQNCLRTTPPGVF